MRPSSSFLLLMLAMCAPVWAGRNGGNGGGGGGGRLGQVTGGLGGAKSSSGSSSDSSSKGSSSESSSNADSYSDAGADYSYTYTDGGGTRVCEDCSANSAPTIRAPIVWPAVSVNGFAGAQKVYESDGSISAELSLVFDGRFRLNAAATRYFERDMTITMAMPSLTAGIQLTQSPTTRLWIEGGVVHLGTKNPFSDPVSMLGSTANVRLEHAVNRNIAVVASAGRHRLRHRHVRVRTARDVDARCVPVRLDGQRPAFSDDGDGGASQGVTRARAPWRRWPGLRHAAARQCSTSPRRERFKTLRCRSHTV